MNNKKPSDIGEIFLHCFSEWSLSLDGNSSLWLETPTLHKPVVHHSSFLPASYPGLPVSIRLI